MKIICALASLLTLLIVGCADNATVDSDGIEMGSIYRKHNVIYERQSSHITFVTQYSTGYFGPTVRLKHPSAAYVNGRRMWPEPASDTVGTPNNRIEYVSRDSVAFPLKHYSFTWVKSEGDTVEDLVSMAPEIEIVLLENPLHINPGESIDLTWTGSPKGEQDRIFIHAGNDSKLKSAHEIVRQKVGEVFGKESVIPWEKVKSLGNRFQVWVSRKRNTDRDVCGDELCIEVESTYLSKPVTVIVD